MKKIGWLLGLWSLCLTARAQSCGTIYDAAVALAKTGAYDLALKKLAAYKLCDPDRSKKADAEILAIYHQVNDQKNLAVHRAETIAAQKDSIQRENTANMLATQALQLNSTDPTKAIQYVYAGLCFSPQNPSLTEIKKNIFTQEVIRKELPGGSKFSTTTIEPFGTGRLVIADAEGFVGFWDPSVKRMTARYRAFKGAVTNLSVLDSVRLLAMGNTSTDLQHPRFSLKLFRADGQEKTVAAGLPAAYSAMACLKGAVYTGDEQGSIGRLDADGFQWQQVKKDSSKIIGLQAWPAAGKVYYATAGGVFDLMTGKRVYQAGKAAPISYFGFCPLTADMYICSGEDIILFNPLTAKEQLLYPVHRHLVSSCHCDVVSGDFMSTSLDGSAAWWSPTGSIRKVMKGNKGSLYDGFLSPGAGYALTVGRSTLGTDTSTLKYWYLKGFLKDLRQEAHLFGATALVYANRYDRWITGGLDGKLKVWNKDLQLVDAQQVAAGGVSGLAWDERRSQLAFGDFEGRTGTIGLDSGGKLGHPDIRQLRHVPVSGVVVIEDKLFTAGKDGMLYRSSLAGGRKDSVYFDSGLTALSGSADGRLIALAAGKAAIVYRPATGERKVFPHNVRVNAVGWLAPKRIVTLSGQFLRVFDTDHPGQPLWKVDNNSDDEMTALAVDLAGRVIYTGTAKGVIVCWDFSGKQLFKLDQLSARVQGLALDSKGSHFLAVDYNGNVTGFYAPIQFLEQELQLGVNCSILLKQLK